MAIIEDSNVIITHLVIVSEIMDSLGIHQYINNVLPKNINIKSVLAQQKDSRPEWIGIQ